MVQPLLLGQLTAVPTEFFQPVGGRQRRRPGPREIQSLSQSVEDGRGTLLLAQHGSSRHWYGQERSHVPLVEPSQLRAERSFVAREGSDFVHGSVSFPTQNSAQVWNLFVRRLVGAPLRQPPRQKLLQH